MRLTKRFMDWYQGNNDKEKETPKGGVKRVGYVLWNYAGRLVGANVLFLLCCIPIVTIPAALSALNRYLSAIYRVGYGFSLEDYWKEFKSDILKNLPAGVWDWCNDLCHTYWWILFCNVRYVRPWRGGIAEKYISHYGIGMEAEYGDRNHCGNCRRNFAGTGTIFSVSAAYDRRFFSADGDICLCGQGRGAKGAAAL